LHQNARPCLSYSRNTHNAYFYATSLTYKAGVEQFPFIKRTFVVEILLLTKIHTWMLDKKLVVACHASIEVCGEQRNSSSSIALTAVHCSNAFSG